MKLKTLLACSVYGVLVGFAYAGNGSCMNQIIPLYVYPSAAGTQPPWTTLTGKTGGNYNSPLQPGLTRWIILSVPLTPSDIYNSDWGTVIEELHDPAFSPPGTKALVYINMQYGSIPEATVFAQIDKLVALYQNQIQPENNPPFTAQLHVDGVFFDQAPYTQSAYNSLATPQSYVQYITDIQNHVVTSGLGVTSMDYFFNGGFWPDQQIVNVVPQLNTHWSIENTYAMWSTIDVPDMPSWVPSYAPGKFVSFINTVTNSAQMELAAQLAQSINTPTIYVTDLAYNSGLPTFWNSLYIPQTNSGCCVPLSGRN